MSRMEHAGHFDGTPESTSGRSGRTIALLLGKGQALMHMDKAESAVECLTK